MKKIFIALSASLLLLGSCKSLVEEWQPVFTFGPDNPKETPLYTEESLKDKGFSGTFTKISVLKAMYKNGGLTIESDIWIKGQVISSDVTGNVYRELYIQDETGGIDVKVGKSSLYSEFTLGQWVYVYCQGLQLGAYNGMPQLGMAPDDTETNEYETSYIDVQAIIDGHVFRGAKADPVAPAAVTEKDIKAAISAGYTGSLWGKLVTISGLKHKGDIFALVYPNPNLPHKSANPENRVFLSDSGLWGITTWSMSKAKYISYIQAGNFDNAEVGSGRTRYGSILGTPAQYLPAGTALDRFGNDATLTYKEIMIKYATANYVSHYFKVGSTDVQVRTSGYAKFSDVEIDPDVLSGKKTVEITGILSIYNGSAQFTLVDEPSVSVKIIPSKAY